MLTIRKKDFMLFFVSPVTVCLALLIKEFTVLPTADIYSVVLFCILLSICWSRAGLFVIFVLAFFILRITFLISYSSLDFQVIAGDVAVLIKISNTILSLITLKYFIELNKNSQIIWTLQIYGLWLIIFFSIVVSTLGYGYSTYGHSGGLGAKGFFRSGNEFALLFFCTAWLTLYLSERWFIFKIAAIQLIGLLIATKVAILTAPILFVYRVNKNYLFRFLIFVVILCGILYYSDVGAIIDISPIIERFKYILESRGVITLIMSGRDEFVREAFQQLSNSEIRNILFGVPKIGMVHFYGKELVEVDLIDLILIYGFVGSLFFLLSFLVIAKLNLNFFTNRRFTMFLIILLAISVVPGHVIYSSFTPNFVIFAACTMVSDG